MHNITRDFKQTVDKSIILHIARFDFGADLSNFKVKLGRRYHMFQVFRGTGPPILRGRQIQKLQRHDLIILNMSVVSHSQLPNNDTLNENAVHHKSPLHSHRILFVNSISI